MRGLILFRFFFISHESCVIMEENECNPIHIKTFSYIIQPSNSKMSLMSIYESGQLYILRFLAERSLNKFKYFEPLEIFKKFYKNFTTWHFL